MKIAIVDDNPNDAAHLKTYVEEYFQETKEKYSIDVFQRGLNFLDQVKQLYDMVFLDIDMPVIDGLEVSKKLRGLDEEVDIVFVTNYASLAINGYEVSASGFLVKPVKKNSVYQIFEKYKSKYNRNKEPKKLLIKADGKYKVLRIEEIYYLEVMKHDVTIHAKDGDYIIRGVLRELEAELAPFDFAMCSNCYLVNLHYVDSLDTDNVYINDAVLSISKSRKKEFTKKFLESIS